MSEKKETEWVVVDLPLIDPSVLLPEGAQISDGDLYLCDGRVFKAGTYLIGDIEVTLAKLKG